MLMKFKSPFRRPGLRFQLTIWYTLVFAVLIFCSGMLMYMHLQNTLISSLDTELRIRSHQIADDITDDKGMLVFRNNTDELPGFDKDDASEDQKEPVNYADVNIDTLARVLDARGHTIGVTPTFQELHVPQASVDLPLQGTPWEGNVSATDGEQVRVYSRTLTDDGKSIAVIQVGASLTQLRAALASLMMDFLWLAPITLCLSAIGSYALASRTFKPIDHLISTAKRIKEGDLHQRVPLPATHDEVHRLALTLNEMLEALEQNFTRQRRFVSEASHELRTPVAAIRSLTDVALLKPLSEEKYISTLRNINKEAVRLGSLISELLMLVRIDEGKTRIQKEPVCLDMLVEAVITNAQPLANKRNLTIQKQIAASVIVQGDEARLIQMIMNLLDNAIYYTDPGGCVTLQLSEEKHYASLTISDTGIGIAEEHLPHIFERFYRADPTHTSTEGGSSGLGLAIVKWIVQAHEGSITVVSKPDVGSTFTVRLPSGSPSTEIQESGKLVGML
jgi:two-component system OmpR family sensor kinase